MIPKAFFKESMFKRCLKESYPYSNAFSSCLKAFLKDSYPF